MSPLSLFIIFIIAITFTSTKYTLNRLKETVKPSTREVLPHKNYNDFWQNAEITNGRLAMMGLLAVVVNYGLFGWIIPGFF